MSNIDPTEFYLPSEKLVTIKDLTEVDESQRFIQIGDGNLIYIQKIYPQMTGAIQAFAGETAPTEWLLCDGSEKLISDYPDLYSYIKNIYGKPDNELNFKLPDLRGCFLRGLDGSAGKDPDRVIGTYQEDSIQTHTHKVQAVSSLISGNITEHGKARYEDGGFETSAPNGARISNETRPKNVAINYFIHI